MINKQSNNQNQLTKRSVIETYQAKDADTGSFAVQIALLTNSINTLQSHFAAHGKDNHSRRGLRAKIEKRRKLMHYMKKHQPDAYQQLIGQLGIRG